MTKWTELWRDLLNPTYHSSLIWGGDSTRNIYFSRTEAISNQLKKKGLKPISVHRHHVFDKQFYVIELEKVILEFELASILDIPEEWIGFISTDPWTYYIKEEEFNNKYCNEKGEIVFDKKRKSENMKMVSEVLTTLIDELTYDDLPINVLVDGKLYDIKDFYFDEKIHEYVMELHGGYEYEGGE